MIDIGVSLLVVEGGVLFCLQVHCRSTSSSPMVRFSLEFDTFFVIRPAFGPSPLMFFLVHCSSTPASFSRGLDFFLRVRLYLDIFSNLLFPVSARLHT